MVGEKIYVIVRAPFFTKRFDLEQKVIQQITKAQKPVREVKDKSPKRTHTSGRFIWKKFRKNWLRILKSFKVRRFRINIDTDNFITNSLIFPITYFAQMRGYQVSINYMGMQSVSLVNHFEYKQGCHPSGHHSEKSTGYQDEKTIEQDAGSQN